MITRRRSGRRKWFKSRNNSRRRSRSSSRNRNRLCMTKILVDLLKDGEWKLKRRPGYAAQIKKDGFLSMIEKNVQFQTKGERQKRKYEVMKKKRTKSRRMRRNRRKKMK